MYKEPRKFFKRFLLLTLLTIINITITVALSTAGVVGAVIAFIFIIINAFFLIAFLVIAVIHFVKYLFDRSKTDDFIMHTVNLLMSIAVCAVFLVFYFTIFISVGLILGILT